MQCLAKHAPNSTKNQFTKFGPRTARDPKEGDTLSNSKANFKKKPRGLSNREKLRECLIFDSGCTGWQSDPQNQLNISLPNLVH